MKSRIVRILRSAANVVSGQDLSAELGISRVSVWKHVRRLREMGYDIQAGPTGYRMVGSPEALYPWELAHWGSHARYFATLGSTMDEAKEIARSGCPHLTVVVADRQEKGRGRLRRVWLSSPGGLYFTIVLRPDIATELTPRFNFLASLVLAKTLRGRFGIDARVKWPNDILVGGRKLAGMLAEMEAEADRVTFLNIGFGINVNNDPHPEEQRATSLKKLLKRPVSRAELLTTFLDDFSKRLDAGPLEGVIDEWKTVAMTIGRPVRIATTRETTEGIAEDVDPSGALLVRRADGSLKRVISGDCFQ